MLNKSEAFSGFSVLNLQATKDFYSTALGLSVTDGQMGLYINIHGLKPIFVYEKSDHQPATYTILNFPVLSIDSAIEELTSKGIVFEQYDMGNGVTTDEKGVLRGLAANMGPDIAWFKDPSGNILSILQEA